MMNKKTIFFTVIVCAGFFLSGAFAASAWVAKVNGSTITSSDLDKMLSDQQLLAEITTGRNVDFQSVNPTFKRQILENQIMQKLMVEEIKKMNSDKKFTSESEIQSQKTKVANIIEQSLWLKAYSDKILRPQITVSSQAIDNFYNANKDQFKNATRDQANAFIKEELTLQQLQPLIVALQNKVKSEASVNINDNYFNK